MGIYGIPKTCRPLHITVLQPHSRCGILHDMAQYITLHYRRGQEQRTVVVRDVRKADMVMGWLGFRRVWTQEQLDI